MRDEELKSYRIDLSRSNFISSLVSDKKIFDCVQLLQYIDSMELDDEQLQSSRKGAAPSTNGILHYQETCSRATVTSNMIDLSRFRLNQIHESDKMLIKKMNVTVEIMLNVIRESNHLVMPGHETALEDFLEQETKKLDKIRLALDYFSFKMPVLFTETVLQVIFTLYTHSLCEEFFDFTSKVTNLSEGNDQPKKFGTYGINKVKLTAPINVMDKRGNKKAVSMSGYSDVALVHSFTSDTTIHAWMTNQITVSSTVIGELKKAGGDLAASTADAILCTHQLIGEAMVLTHMRKAVASSGNKNITKSFLSDLCKIRLLFNMWNNQESLYLVSSMFETSKEFVVCILYLISNFSSEHVNSLVGDDFDLMEEKIDSNSNGNFKRDEKCSDENSNNNNNSNNNKKTSRNLNSEMNNTKMNGADNNNKKDNGYNNNNKAIDRPILQTLYSNNNYLFRTNPLKLKQPEEEMVVINICEDPKEVERQENLRILEEFELARFGFAYLSAESLSKIK